MLHLALPCPLPPLSFSLLVLRSPMQSTTALHPRWFCWTSLEKELPRFVQRSHHLSFSSNHEPKLTSIIVHCLLQVDGLSLLTATLQHWLAKGHSCPNVIVSTHFHSLIQQQLLPNSQLIEYLVRSSFHKEQTSSISSIRKNEIEVFPLLHGLQTNARVKRSCGCLRNHGAFCVVL